WQLHGVEPNYWTRGAGLIFRLAAGIWMARFVIYWRLTAFRTWGVSMEELTELLHDADAQVRLGAALCLGPRGPAAASATPGLIAALKDVAPAIRIAAARSLGQ